MAKIPRIQFKRTKSPGVKPSKDILAEGELAINLADRMLFTKSGEEIIDLGFAKGGTVNGDIIQETGNFTTNGTIRLKEYININGPDNKALNIAYDSRGPLIGLNEGDNKWKVLQIPAETGTFASREWVNTFVKTGTIQTDLKAPDNTTVLTINNSKLLSFKDGTTDIFAVDIKGGYMRNSLILSGQNDYPGITLQKNDTFKVRIETDTDSSNTLLAFAYRDSDNSNKFVIKMPKEPGINVLATQGWVDGKYYHRDSSTVAFRESISLSRSAGKEKLIIEYNGSNGQWRFAQSADGSTNWMRHVLPTESGTFATREWVQDIHYNKSESDNRYVHLGTGGNIRLHSYKQGGHGYSSWNENNTRVGYVGFGSDGSTEFTINNEKSNGSINLRAKVVQTNGSTIASQPWVLSNFYRKTETYNKSEIDGKVNGRLTQAQGDGRYALNNFFEASGGESRIWNGSKNHYLFVNNNLNSGLYNHSGGKYVWGFNSTGQMTAGLVPVSCGGTGAKDIGTARNNLQVYSKGETYSRAEVDSRVNGRLTQATADGRYAYKGGATGQNFGANIVDAADVNIRSDISVKSNLVYIKNALDLLKPLTGYKYDLRLNDNTHKQSVGIIAQDVQKVLPELVQKDSTDLLSVNYNGLTAVLINAVNELNNRLKELEVKNGSNRT